MIENAECVAHVKERMGASKQVKKDDTLLDDKDLERKGRLTLLEINNLQEHYG